MGMTVGILISKHMHVSTYNLPLELEDVNGANEITGYDVKLSLGGLCG